MSNSSETKKKTVKQKKGGKSQKRRSVICCAPVVNPMLQDVELKNGLLSHFTERSPLVSENVVLHSEPFSVCVVNNFLKEEKFLEQFRDELLDEIFIEKNNDLYRFQQTDDLKKSSGPYAKAFRDFLHLNVKGWLSEVTGIQLNDKVDITCSRYDYTDTLLCHDDELDTRRIAFVLYLVHSWKKEDGGNLDLYDMDAHLQPKDVVTSIVPQFNNFVWFEVTEASHHQVSEVLCKCKSRLTVNGWFHGEPVPRQERHIEPVESPQRWLQIEEDVFFEWINPIYLDPEVQSQIQEKFEADSEIELQGFLQEEKYQAVMEALKGDQVKWEKQGPPNKRCFDQTRVEDASPDPVKNCMKFLQSEMMFLTLSNLTGLTLHPLADFSDSETEEPSCTAGCSASSVRKLDEESLSEGDEREEDSQRMGSRDMVGEMDKCKNNSKRRKIDCDETSIEDKQETETRGKKLPSCLCKVRRWSHGSYTLLHDTDTDCRQFSLDGMLYFNCKDWENSYGGYTSYIAKGEDEELLTVLPTENALALVYRDKETLRFVKHINDSVNTSATDPHFYDFAVVYWE